MTTFCSLYFRTDFSENIDKEIIKDICHLVRILMNFSLDYQLRDERFELGLIIVLILVQRFFILALFFEK